jgi:ABC-type transport system involved in multi-copper enzyme maturation permease subunit
MKEFLNKFKSRKFLTCVAGVIVGVCMMFGLDEGTIDTVAGAIVSLGSICTYIYTEGKIDAAAVSGIKDTVDEVKDAIDEVNKIEE